MQLHPHRSTIFFVYDGKVKPTRSSIMDNLFVSMIIRCTASQPLLMDHLVELRLSWEEVKSSLPPSFFLLAAGPPRGQARQASVGPNAVRRRAGQVRRDDAGRCCQRHDEREEA